MKILAIKWRRLGDTILWSAALEALLQHFPDANVHLALPAEYDALFQAHPKLQTRFALKSDGSSNKLPQAWRAQTYDWVLVFHANPTTRRLAERSGARHRLIHHHSREAKVFGSERPIFDLGKPAPATERDGNVIRTLGWSGQLPATRIHCAPEWKHDAQARWQRLGGREKMVVLAPGASRPSKLWPFERYAALCESIPSDTDIAVIAPTDDAWRDFGYFVDKMKKRVRFIATPRLEDAIGILSLARAFVGSDSGLKHLAAALGVPTVTVFGPESIGEWHPYDPERHVAIQKKVACRTNDAHDPAFAWCGVAVCPYASHSCMTSTEPREVAETLERFL